MIKKKVANVDEALQGVSNNMTLMLGGFGLSGIPENAIATHVAKGLYSTGAGKEAEESIHLLTACEDLIYAAAQGWQEDKGGRYRDDIAISVADLEIDP